MSLNAAYAAIGADGSFDDGDGTWSSDTADADANMAGNTMTATTTGGKVARTSRINPDNPPQAPPSMFGIHHHTNIAPDSLADWEVVGTAAAPPPSTP